MKKLFLGLLIITPLAKSEILELTCNNSVIPFWLNYNFKTNEGHLTYQENLIDLKDNFFPNRHLVKHTKINSFKAEANYYKFVLSKKYKVTDILNLFINRTNLHFEIDMGNDDVVGSCVIGIHDFPTEYQI